MRARLRIRDGVITLEKMYFADEVRPIDEIKVKGVAGVKGHSAMKKRELVKALDSSG